MSQYREQLFFHLGWFNHQLNPTNKSTPFFFNQGQTRRGLQPATRSLSTSWLDCNFSAEKFGDLTAGLVVDVGDLTKV